MLVITLNKILKILNLVNEGEFHTKRNDFIWGLMNLTPIYGNLSKVILFLWSRPKHIEDEQNI